MAWLARLLQALGFTHRKLANPAFLFSKISQSADYARTKPKLESVMITSCFKGDLLLKNAANEALAMS